MYTHTHKESLKHTFYVYLIYGNYICVSLSSNELMPVELLGPSLKQKLQDVPWRIRGELLLSAERLCSAP